MNKSIYFGLLVTPILLAACGKTTDWDGVPRVDDPHHATDANGNPIKGADFIQKYCSGKSTNATCATVLLAVKQDGVKGTLPKGW
jgi:hypothetical protein